MTFYVTVYMQCVVPIMIIHACSAEDPGPNVSRIYMYLYGFMMPFYNSQFYFRLVQYWIDDLPDRTDS